MGSQTSRKSAGTHKLDALRKIKKLKQTNILSFIIMGFIMATAAGLPETSLDQLDEHYHGIRDILSGFQQTKSASYPEEIFPFW